VRIAPKTTELLVQRADYIPGQSVPLFEVRSPVFAGGDWVLERIFDLVVSRHGVEQGPALKRRFDRGCEGLAALVQPGRYH
jgi:hypothetical protein